MDAAQAVGPSVRRPLPRRPMRSAPARFVTCLALLLGLAAPIVAPPLHAQDCALEVIASPALPSDDFGEDVALVSTSLYGARLLVGAPGAFVGGLAYLFESDGSFVRSFAPSDTAPGARYGFAVTGVANHYLAGAPGADAGVGAVYDFEDKGLAFDEKRLMPVGLTGGADRFGFALDMEGAWLAAGAPGPEGFAAPGAEQGAVYLFELVGRNWHQRARLVTPTPAPRISPPREYGRAVALGGDRLAVGEPGRSGLEEGAGRVHVYDRVGAAWVLIGTLIGAENEHTERPRFGHAVALSGDLLAVGAPGRAVGQVWQGDRGRVFLYERVVGLWIPRVELLSPIGDRFDAFGDSLAFADGKLYVGAPGSDATLPDAGQVFVYEEIAGVWQEVSRFRHLVPEELSLFGGALDALDDEVAVGIDTLGGGVLPAPDTNAGVARVDATAVTDLVPWTMQGGDVSGPGALATLSADGLMCEGAVIYLRGTAPVPTPLAWLVVGLSSTPVAFAGGVLLPTVDFLFPRAMPAGETELVLLWPPGVPVGFELWLQLWIPTAAGPFGWIGSEGLLGVQP